MGAPAPSVTAVLVVCTANQCRSPMAQAILQHRLGEYEITATVGSAGLREAGHPALESVVRTLADRGLEATAHRSRRLDVDLVREVDLVLALERAHVREVVVLEPQAWARTFTIKELVRRGAATGPRARDESFSGWLARIHAGRRRADLLGASPDDDVRDPTGGSPDDYEATADELDALLSRFVNLAWGEG
jgi:protein-tyrosine phosphatase